MLPLLPEPDMKKTAAAILFLLMLAVFPTWGDGIMPPEPVLNCRAAVLMDYDTGTVLFSKNPSAEIPPASMTKLMTSFLLFEKIERGELSLDDIYNELASRHVIDKKVKQEKMTN